MNGTINVRTALPHESSSEYPKVFGVLGSRVRYEILQEIASEPKSISDLAQKLGLHRATVRYHIMYLVREGFATELPSTDQKGAGRPAMLYQAAKHVVTPSYPQRHYEIIAELALRELVNVLGEEKATEILYRKGIDIGLSIIGPAVSQLNVENWTPEEFERHFLGGLFKEFGVISEIRSKSKEELVFREYSCPFLELAERMPKFVCDALDNGFHESIDMTIGNTRTEKLACMGHGDPYCEYRMKWNSGPPRKPRKSTKSDENQ